MKQKDALNILKAGRNVFLTGPAGSGKTYVLREYIKYLKEREVPVALTASTGIAATHFGGVTIHSWSGIGIKNRLSDYEIDNLTQKEYLVKRYNNTQVLIIDEVSMLSADILNSIDRLAKAMKGNFKPFGGMQLVLSGDFFQLPPIAKENNPAEFVYKSSAWQEGDIRVCYLDEQWRQDDESLTRVLKEIRDGDVSQEIFELLESQKEKEFKSINPTRLFTHNADVDILNEKELENISGNIFSYKMQSKGKKNLVSFLKKSLLAPEYLNLKEDAVVMFVKNNFEKGYVNGTLGIVKGFSGETPIVETFDGERIYVEETDWTIEDDGRVLAKVSQLPLRLAWAITVHKSQGMTLDAAEIDLSKSFVPGQGYVALSRLRNLDGLLLRGLNSVALSVNEEILEFDMFLKKESKKWEKVIERFAEKEMNDMANEFVVVSGGTINIKKIKKNRKKEPEKIKEKLSTYQITKGLLDEGLSIKEISEQRGLKDGTIISHVEKLIEDNPENTFDHIKPNDKDMDVIKKAFSKSKDGKLAPIHKKLKGKYSFDELRLARVFLNIM